MAHKIGGSGQGGTGNLDDRFSDGNDPFNRGRGGRGGYESGQLVQGIESQIQTPDNASDFSFVWRPMREYPIKTLKQKMKIFIVEIWKGLQFKGKRRWRSYTLIAKMTKWTRLEAYLDFDTCQVTVAELFLNPAAWPPGFGICIKESGQQPAMVAYRRSDKPNAILILEEIEAQELIRSGGKRTIRDTMDLSAADFAEIGFLLEAGKFDQFLAVARKAITKKGGNGSQAILIIGETPEPMTKGDGSTVDWEWMMPRPRQIATAEEFDWLFERWRESFGFPDDPSMVLAVDSTYFDAPPVSDDWKDSK